MMDEAGKLNTRKARNVAAITRYDWADVRFRLFSRNGTKYPLMPVANPTVKNIIPMKASGTMNPFFPMGG